MYREPLLTREDAESLIGKLVRLEYSSPNTTDYVGIMSRVRGGDTRGYLYLDRGADGEKELLFLSGMYVVFATTYDDLRPAGEEPAFHPVEWHNRHTLTGEPAPRPRPQSRIQWPAVDPAVSPRFYEYAPTRAPRTAWTDGGIVVDELEDWERDLLA